MSRPWPTRSGAPSRQCTSRISSSSSPGTRECSRRCGEDGLRPGHLAPPFLPSPGGRRGRPGRRLLLLLPAVPTGPNRSVVRRRLRILRVVPGRSPVGLGLRRERLGDQLGEIDVGGVDVRGAGALCALAAEEARAWYYFVRSTDLLLNLNRIEIKRLYFSRYFGPLLPGAVATAAQRAGLARSLEHVARAVRSLLHARRPARGVSSLPAGIAQRQPPQVEECDAGAHQRSGDL